MGSVYLEGGQCHALQPNLHLLRQVTGDQSLTERSLDQGKQLRGWATWWRVSWETRWTEGRTLSSSSALSVGARRTNGVQAATSLSTAAENTRNSTGRSTNHRAVPIKFAVHQTSAA